MALRSSTLAVCSAILVVVVVSGCSGAPVSAGSDASATSVTGSTVDLGEATDSARTAWLDRGNCHDVAPVSETSAAASSFASMSPKDSAATRTLLTLTGPPLAGALTVNMATLDAMEQVKCTVNDRQGEGRDVTFTGVLLADMLADLGAAGATTLHTLALNDYAVDIPMSDVDAFPVLLATRSDGRPMSVANYGPLRIVYPTTGYDLDPTVYDPRWIWQLSAIELK